MGISEAAFSIVLNLISGVIQKAIDFSTLDFFERRRIHNRIENAVAEVVKPLIPFLENEGITIDKQLRLVETCAEELTPLTIDPNQLFQGSLNGQIIFENLYSDRDLPQVILDDGLKDIYRIFFPRIATILCKIPAAAKEWESEAWKENFRRFDEIAKQLRDVFVKVDELTNASHQRADSTLTTVRKALAQKIGFDLDITGLRSERPLSGKFDDFFIQPQISLKSEKEPYEVLHTVDTDDSSFNEFIHKRCRAIITGVPGSGKSTWSKWLQKETVTDKWEGISVRVVLRNYADASLPSLFSLVRSAAGKHYEEELTSDLIKKWIEAKQVSFILDGFDEVSPDKRDVVSEWIVELGIAASPCSILLTSRPLTTDHLDKLWKDADNWIIEPFDENRIVDYIERWYKYADLLIDSDGLVGSNTLASSWLADPTIGPLTGNPLLLSTLLTVHHLDGSLPSGRSQLYQRYVSGMLGLWDARRKVTATSIDIRPEHKPKIIQGLALKMFFEEKDQLDEDEISEILSDLLCKLNLPHSSKDVLCTLQERSGLIVGPGIYSFVHKSVAEYLVAEAILQGDQIEEAGSRIDRFYLFKNRQNDQWNTVIFLWAGLAPVRDVEFFIETCIEAESLSLAYGILLDQYEKFSPQICRTLLLKTSGLKIEKNGGEIAFLGYDHPYNISSQKLQLPFHNLRSIAQRGDFHDLLTKAFEDETLAVSDATSFRGSLRDVYLAWALFSLRTLSEFRYFIINSDPEIFEKGSWASRLSSYLFELNITEEADEEENIVDCTSLLMEKYQDCHTAIIYTLIQKFIKTFSSIYEPSIKKTENSLFDAIHEGKSVAQSYYIARILIKLITSISLHDINLESRKEWLIGTQSHQVDSNKENLNVALPHSGSQDDLIGTCIGILKKHAIQDNSFDAQKIETAALFFDKLMERRSSYIVGES